MTKPKPVTLRAAALTSGPPTFGVPTVFVSLPPEHPFYALIGRVAAEGARLEHTLDLIIWELAGIDHKIGSCITAQLTGSFGRFNAIEALAAATGFDKAMLRSIAKLAGKTNEVLKSRHRFVHDAWYEGGERTGQFKSFLAKDQKFGMHEVTEADALKTIEIIREQTSKVAALRTELQKGPPAAQGGT
jgi:hypothetical protein